MNVRPFDSALRFMVGSDSGGETEYLVELDAFDGNGRCACQHFQHRIEPELVAGHRFPSPVRCKHIKAAREYLTEAVIEKISAASTPPNAPRP